MLRNLLGAAIGRQLVGSNSGARGALIGAMTPFIVRRAFGPLGLALAGGYAAKKIYDRRRTKTSPR